MDPKRCMLKIYILFLLITQTTSLVYALDVASLLAEVDAQKLEAHVEALAASPRYSSAELATAESYITTELASYGYTVSREELVFDVDPNDSTPARVSANIIAELRGTTTPEAIYIVGAHFDTVPGTPGADDNASGVAGTLELARVLAGHAIDKTVRFIAFTFEETGVAFVGSEFHAQQAIDNNEQIIGMTSLEMIGYRCDTPGCQIEFKDDPINCMYSFDNSSPCEHVATTCMDIVPSGVNTGTGITVTTNAASSHLLNHARRAGAQYLPEHEILSGEIVDTGACFGNARASDHFSFWSQGMPAFMLNDTAFYRNPHYHLPTDAPDTLDYEFLAQNVRLQLATILSVVNPPPIVVFHGVTNPSFIDTGFGPDHRWDTADDVTVTGANPSGALSGFRGNNPNEPPNPAGAFFGVFENIELSMSAPIGFGENSIVSGTLDLYATVLTDEASGVPQAPTTVHAGPQAMQSNPSHVSQIDFKADNTFTSNRMFRYTGTFDEFPILTHLDGYYLTRSQNPNEVFSTEPDVAAWFTTVLPSLPVDWQIVLYDRFVTVIPEAPSFTYNNIVALYSTDPQAVPTGAISEVLIPYPSYGLLILIVLIVVPALRPLRAADNSRRNFDH